jgi:hypothetical protein
MGRNLIPRDPPSTLTKSNLNQLSEVQVDVHAALTLRT